MMGHKICFNEVIWLIIPKLSLLLFSYLEHCLFSSVVRGPSTISNDFSSETTGQIATKFHIETPGPLRKKSCSMVWVT